MNRLAILIAGAVMAASPLILPAAAAAQDDDVLRFATSFAYFTVDPVEGGMRDFGVAESLVQFRSDGQFHPWLLSSLENIDETTWRLTLRENVTFQNGRPLDAEAALAAITHQLENRPSAAATVPQGGRFEVTGPHELTFTSDIPFPALPGLLAGEILIYDVDALLAAEGDTDSIIDAQIYTGPYIVERATSEELFATRYDGYWQGVPALSGVEFVFSGDPNARMLAVQNGEIDIALFMPIAVQRVVAATPGLHFAVEERTSNGYTAFLNLARPPLDDPRARLALIKGLDYEAIADEIFSGLFEPARSFYAPFFEFAVENIASDRDEAMRLLDEAGWIMAEDGLRYRDGEPFHLDVVYNPGVSDLVDLANGLQAHLRELGISLASVTVDDTYAAYGQRDWNMGLHNHSSSGGGFPESFLSRYMTNDAPRNYGGYSNAEIDAIAAELTVTIDPARRNALLARVQEIMVEEDPGFMVLVSSGLGVVTNDAYAHYTPGFNFFNVDWQTAPSR